MVLPAGRRDDGPMRKFLRWIATKLGPYALVGYGVLGLYLARRYGHGWTGDSIYGVVAVSPASPGHAAWYWAEAVLFFAVGGWLITRWRLPGSALARSVPKRLWATRTRGIPRGQEFLVLLPPVIMLQLTVTHWDPGGAVAVALLMAIVLALAFRSRLWAATLAAAGLIVLGCYGLLLAVFWPQFPGNHYGFTHTGEHTFLGCGIQGAIMLGLGLWLAPRVIGVHTGAYTAELEARTVELTERVETLTQTRTDAVGTAAAELRRIERDLHDGAQARLVALGMSLQAAERLFATSPEAALALVSEAKEASSKALTELRDLVRGIYPPVLADRGLADAVRALALDAPLHTVVTVDLPGEVEMPVASAVYFALAEILTNAVRHAGAHTVRIHFEHHVGMLRAQITDDGAGGADSARGTGLKGIERRLATFDGILAVNSPPGGPTIVVIEVPCALSSPKTSSC
jgi:signal transduction histidine kinase